MPRVARDLVAPREHLQISNHTTWFLMEHSMAVCTHPAAKQFSHPENQFKMERRLASKALGYPGKEV